MPPVEPASAREEALLLCEDPQPEIASNAATENERQNSAHHMHQSGRFRDGANLEVFDMGVDWPGGI